MKSILKGNALKWMSIAVVFCLPATVAMAEGESAWESSASLGLSLTRGNSETLVVNGAVTADRKTDNDALHLGVQGNYGETEIDGEDVTTTKDVKAVGQYNRDITDRLYWLVATSILYDKIAGIDYRWTVGPGLGAYLIKNDSTTLGVDVGPTYIREKLADGTEDDIASLRVGERFDHNLSETAKIWQAAEYLADFDDFGAYLFNAEVGVEAVLKAALSLRVVLQDRYDSKPLPGLEKNDLALITSLVYKF
jgi:putative salt-induced outer membrane protein YdiY